MLWPVFGQIYDSWGNAVSSRCFQINNFTMTGKMDLLNFPISNTPLKTNKQNNNNNKNTQQNLALRSLRESNNISEQQSLH